MVATGLCILFLTYLLIRYFGTFSTVSPTLGGKPIAFGLPGSGLGTIRYNGGLMQFIWPRTAGLQGYDGQFTYYIARDLLDAKPNLDVPAYRFQRILHPLMVRLLSLGQE